MLEQMSHNRYTNVIECNYDTQQTLVEEIGTNKIVLLMLN